MTEDIITKIKTKGYWRIHFQPLVDKEKLDSLILCKDIVEKNRVELRGWDYPHFPTRKGENTGLNPCGTYYEGWIDWWNHKEYWRMYKSAQFIHYLALREDWLEDSEWDNELAKRIKPFENLGILGSVVYQMTEIYLFLSRLAQNGIYDEGVSFSLTLLNTKNRGLWVDDQRRLPIFYELKTGAEKLEFSENYQKDELISEVKELTFKMIMQILDSFGWESPPIEVIKNDIDNFLSGKI